MFRRHLVLAAVILLAATRAPAGEAALDKAGPLEKKWQPLHELMAALAERDGLRWAMPETLAGRVLVGGEALTARAALDEACPQAKLAWAEANGVVLVHRPDDARLKELSATLPAGGAKAAEAAWELGWLRDARAVPALAEALGGKDPAVALAAAQAVEVLCKSIPLGRTDRVEPALPGRVELAAASPPKADLAPLLDSPYPAVRAAAARLMLGQGGAPAEAAKTKTAADKSFLVEQVRQQALFGSAAAGKPRPKSDLPPVPKTEEEVKAACDKLFAELSPLGKASEWEQMRRRARILAAWANTGNDYAFETLVRCTRFEQGNCSWFPPYAQKCLTSVGGEKAVAKLKEIMPGADHAAVSRFLEQWTWGQGMLEFTKPYLGEQTVCCVSAWKAGREGLDDFLALAGKSSYPYPAVDALAVIGGPKAVALLRELMLKEEKGSGTLAFRSAKALGQIGGAEALAALLAAADAPERQRRHAAVLFLGRIGGPEAVRKLAEVLGKDPERLVRAAAADALEQIGAKEGLEAAAAFRKADEGLPALVYQPRNKRFGPEFPENEWVNLGIGVIAYDNWGEMGWNYDAANKFFFRYGGCSGYTNELTLFDAGTEKFTQRRPNEEMAGWDQCRPPRGCSAGRTWDAVRKVAWIGPAIGGSEEDLAIAEYYNRRGFGLSSYDLATDRFRSAAQAPNCGRYVYDAKHGLLMPVAFTHPNHLTKDWVVFDTKGADPYSKEAWKVKTDPAREYPFSASERYTNAAVHQETGLLVLYVPRGETWTYDPEANLWKNMQAKDTPKGVSGGGLVYEPFGKVMILQSGKVATQFGGAGDSITWAYDLKANAWKDLGPKNGPGNPWVGSMDFDPEHNVIVLFDFSHRNVWAYRYKQVPAGTRAQ